MLLFIRPTPWIPDLSSREERRKHEMTIGQPQGLIILLNSFAVQDSISTKLTMNTV